MAFDKDGTLFIADTVTSVIYRLNASTDSLEPFVGRFGTKAYRNDVVKSGVRLRSPLGLQSHRASDALYFSDFAQVIRRILPSGAVEHVAGNESQPPGTGVFLQDPNFKKARLRRQRNECAVRHGLCNVPRRGE